MLALMLYDLHTVHDMSVDLYSVCCTHEVQIDHGMMCLKRCKGNQNHEDPMVYMTDFAIYLNMCIHNSFRFILFLGDLDKSPKLSVNEAHSEQEFGN